MVLGRLMERNPEILAFLTTIGISSSDFSLSKFDASPSKVEVDGDR